MIVFFTILALIGTCVALFVANTKLNRAVMLQKMTIDSQAQSIKQLQSALTGYLNERPEL